MMESESFTYEQFERMFNKAFESYEKSFGRDLTPEEIEAIGFLQIAKLRRMEKDFFKKLKEGGQ